MKFGTVNNIQLLSTRPVGTALVEAAAAFGIVLDERAFIETKPIVSDDVVRAVAERLQQQATVAFTSMNAVEAVAALKKDRQPHWTIYSVGSNTSRLAAAYFGAEQMAGTASSAAALAEQIIRSGNTSAIVFFCGNQRLDELPDLLRSQGIRVDEIVVYETLQRQQRVTTDYDGILFFSPSAVHSFFSTNNPQEGTVFFAIGSTTAAAIGKYTHHKVVVSMEPGKENLVKEAIAYFSKMKTDNPK